MSTPEFCFLQMASVLPLVRLIELGTAMCGRYWPSDDARGFVDIEPLTSVGRLRRFVAGCAGLRGVKRARRALRWIVDGSRSPMETTTELLLCLERRLGGYGLPRPELNFAVPLDDGAASVSGRTRCELDICWPRRRFAVEYQGREYHRSERRDVSRELGLARMGYRLQFVTFDQVRYQNQTQELVRGLARALGRRLRRALPHTARRRRELLATILPSPGGAKPPWALPGRNGRAGQGAALA